MSKLSKEKLKKIMAPLVKECLIEILQEGIADVSLTEARPPRGRKNTNVAESKSTRETLPRSPAMDHIKFEKAVETSAKNLTQDPVMQSIFTDTAKTTLQEQYSAGTPGDSAHLTAPPSAASGINPDEVFPGASNWSELAFSPALKK
jgi:hypothetical protein